MLSGRCSPPAGPALRSQPSFSQRDRPAGEERRDGRCCGQGGETGGGEPSPPGHSPRAAAKRRGCCPASHAAPLPAPPRPLASLLAGLQAHSPAGGTGGPKRPPSSPPRGHGGRRGRCRPPPAPTRLTGAGPRGRRWREPGRARDSPPERRRKRRRGWGSWAGATGPGGGDGSPGRRLAAAHGPGGGWPGRGTPLALRLPTGRRRERETEGRAAWARGRRAGRRERRAGRAGAERGFTAVLPRRAWYPCPALPLPARRRAPAPPGRLVGEPCTCWGRASVPQCRRLLLLLPLLRAHREQSEAPGLHAGCWGRAPRPRRCVSAVTAPPLLESGAGAAGAPPPGPAHTHTRARARGNARRAALSPQEPSASLPLAPRPRRCQSRLIALGSGFNYQVVKRGWCSSWWRVSPSSPSSLPSALAGTTAVWFFLLSVFMVKATSSLLRIKQLFRLFPRPVPQKSGTDTSSGVPGPQSVRWSPQSLRPSHTVRECSLLHHCSSPCCSPHPFPVNVWQEIHSSSTGHPSRLTRPSFLSFAKML